MTAIPKFLNTGIEKEGLYLFDADLPETVTYSTVSRECLPVSILQLKNCSVYLIACVRRNLQKQFHTINGGCGSLANGSSCPTSQAPHHRIVSRS